MKHTIHGLIDPREVLPGCDRRYAARLSALDDLIPARIALLICRTFGPGEDCYIGPG